MYKVDRLAVLIDIGRAICVVAGNPPGSNNYDLNDDLPGGDGSRQLSLHIDKFGDMLI